MYVLFLYKSFVTSRFGLPNVRSHFRGFHRVWNARTLRRWAGLFAGASPELGWAI